MKRFVKWAALILTLVLFAGLTAFLYFIPPFFTTPPEEFTRAMNTAAPEVTNISDPLERVLAARGRQIVVRTGCIGCHAQNGPQGPDLTRYLAGGGLKIVTPTATYVSRNLTPEPETGLARRTDEEVLRVLRSGVFPDGHVVPHTVMPWANFSNWTEEDRRAVVVYLRHLPPVAHRIPEPVRAPNALGPGVIERDYAFKEYGVQP